MHKPSAIIVTCTALALLSTPAFSQEKTFDFEQITSVDVSSGIHMTIEYGNIQSVIATARRDTDFDHLNLEMMDAILRVAHSIDFWDSISAGGIINAIFQKNEPIELAVTLSEINSVLASSGASVNLMTFTGEQLSLEANSGAKIRVPGKCTILKVTASSGGNISAKDLNCLNIEATASSGENIKVFASDNITASASSGGNISIFGNPVQRDVRKVPAETLHSKTKKQLQGADYN